MEREIERLIWEGDTDRLQEIAPCQCCCHEHTYATCPARHWNGCRSGLPYGVSAYTEAEAWATHYNRHHGLTRAQFFAEEAP